MFIKPGQMETKRNFNICHDQTNHFIEYYQTTVGSFEEKSEKQTPSFNIFEEIGG